ncbi:hypothetical protein JGH11_19180 [Dysgonomonas sp. Marseille-P4677]|uniref:hypothetical protein n=1 Tax=Dysgonomonas sp. Marseille-P4677 TaxID=2364790 RepID=UPI001912A3BE|nr:hypothetical protein [Dysgonomonas sp. Marseille-P4677]MBK5722996.1 hypothetical protein [Dysgonomonas sp. Marseille-P4677]
MKKYILSIILVLTTTTVFAQDQTVNGNFKVTGGSVLRADLYVGEWDVSNKTGLGD